MSVTPAGQRIVEQAQRVLEEAARIKELAAAGRDPLAGPLRLGAIYTIGPYLLPKLIPILRKNAPAMQLLIQENFTHVLSEQLKNGEVDAILIALPFDEPGIAECTAAVPRLREAVTPLAGDPDETIRESAETFLETTEPE